MAGWYRKPSHWAPQPPAMWELGSETCCEEARGEVGGGAGSGGGGLEEGGGAEVTGGGGAGGVEGMRGGL